MNVDDVMSFITAARLVLQTDLELEITFGRPVAGSGGGDFAGDVSGIIDFEGGITGSLVLALPASTAQKIAGRLRGEPIGLHQLEISEVLGSLLAGIRSEVETRLALRDVHVGRPSIVIGPGHRVRPAEGSSCVCIPLECRLGRLRLEVALESMPAAAC